MSSGTKSQSQAQPPLDVKLASCATKNSILHSIPPERVGINGEYDYRGLEKRVMLALNQAFHPDDLKNLKVRQRGSVIMLLGKVPSQSLLHSFRRVALSISGTTDVEVNGISIVPPFGRLPLAIAPSAYASSH